jgi:hypothetical protein
LIEEGVPNERALSAAAFRQAVAAGSHFRHVFARDLAQFPTLFTR